MRSNGSSIRHGYIKEVLDCSDGTVHRKDELLALDKRLDANEEFSGNRYFWNSEDMVHRRPGYYLAVNISSVRSNGPESVSPFSVVNYHFPFGSMMIKTRGDEYLTARGAINYSALPGITSDPSAPLPKEETWMGFHGDNQFCGGVSDGDCGVCGFIQRQKEFTAAAHKSYFFFDGGLVALGAGISGTNLETTINQTQWRGPITWGEGSKSNQIAESGGTFDEAVHQPAWLYHDGVGYLVLPATDSTHLKVTAETRKTRWVEICKTNADNPKAAATIVQISLPHDASSDAYAYAVLPGVKPESLTDTARSLPFTVLANTSQVQAVRFTKENLIEAVFFAPGSIHCADGDLSVDRASVVMLRQSDGKWELSLSDPLQLPGAGDVNIESTLPGIAGGPSHPVHLTCALPSKPWIGSAARKELTQ
jgi:chondroitin AC lyase